MKKLFLTLCAIFLLSINVFSHEDSNGYIVKLKENISLPFTSFSSEEIADTNLNASLAAEILSQNETEITEIYAEKGLVKVHDEQILSELTEMGIVEYAEKDLICEFYDYTPEDNPYYSNQWGISAVKAPFAWSVGVFGKGVKVAVIDSGCNVHEDLEGNILPGANFEGISDIGATPTGDYSDNLYHGTFVSGIIAAKCNDVGIMGLSPDVKIVPLKVCDSSTFKLSYVIPAIYAAVDYFDCDVINMSLGASTYDPKSENGGGLKYDANGNLVSGTMIQSSALSDAIAYAVKKLGGKACIFNRTVANAKAIADKYGFNKEEIDGKVPDTTLFCLDLDRNIFVGAVNIRHYLNEAMLLNGGHIGDGIRPSERRKGYATETLKLAMEKAKERGIKVIYVAAYTENIGSIKTIESCGFDFEDILIDKENGKEVKKYSYSYRKKFTEDTKKYGKNGNVDIKVMEWVSDIIYGFSGDIWRYKFNEVEKEALLPSGKPFLASGYTWIEFYDYKSNNRPWESYEDSIKVVAFEEGITSIGTYAFYHCEKLQQHQNCNYNAKSYLQVPYTKFSL